VRNNSATAELYELARQRPIHFKFARYGIILAKRPTMLSDYPITDAMSQAERVSIIHPYYYGRVIERADGTDTPHPGKRVSYTDENGYVREEDCNPYTFWIDPRDCSWKNWKLRKFYPFETLVRLGISEVIRQAGGRL
jgi:hypothetical protein